MMMMMMLAAAAKRINRGGRRREEEEVREVSIISYLFSAERKTKILYKVASPQHNTRKTNIECEKNSPTAAIL